MLKCYFNIRCERRDLTELELFDLELEVMLKVSFQRSGSLSWLDDRCILLLDCFGLAFGPLLVLSCCSASSGKYPTGLTQ